MNDVFEFKQCQTLLKSTGSNAKSLSELRDVIAEVSEASLFHHMHQYFLKGHILEYTNDFAQWAGENLEERQLAEELSNIDPYDFGSIASLRANLIGVISNYLKRFPEVRDTRRGEEFYFNETITLVFPAGVWAKNLAEFLLAVKYVDPTALYYHFFDSRQRLGGRMNDFSQWLETTQGKKDLADQLMTIDPFVHSMEGIRERIIAALEGEVQKDMETAGYSISMGQEVRSQMEAAGVQS